MVRRRTVDEHAGRIAALVGPTLARHETEVVPLASSLGRVTSEPITTSGPLPPFRNAQMDGYAARAADIRRAPVVLPVDGVLAAAASEAQTLEPGHLLKVMTGAPVPEGADCIVPVEQTVEEEGGVRIVRPVEPGAFVREPGSDALPGTVVVPAYTHLAPRHIAAAAAAGVAEVAVRRRPRVAVIATGAEVVPPGTPLAHGQVHDVNGVTLAALAAEAGAVPVLVDLTPDESAAFEEALLHAVGVADLVLTAGGVSKGDFEVVRQVLEPLGADVTEIAMQPGGPQGSASVRGVPVVCLPGNPVSAQVSFTVFLRPLLRGAVGLPPIPAVPMTLAAAVHSPKGKRQWLRGVVKDGTVFPVGGPGSHRVVAMAGADVLIDVPADVDFVGAGSTVSVLPLDSLDENGPMALTHLDDQGRARMIDVGAKPSTRREAVARGRMVTTAEVVRLLLADGLPKADALATARIAGIAGAKRTSDLIPLCHPLPIDAVTVDLVAEGESVLIEARVSTTGRTGVEMEALTAVTVAGLTLHDMVKAVDPGATMTDVQLIEKTGGKHGRWTRDQVQHAPDAVRPGGARVLVVSTGAAAGSREDTTGGRIVAWLREQGLDTPDATIVADVDVATGLRAALQEVPEVLVTTGGTGPSPTDRTPEATSAVLDRRLPGVAEAIRARAGTPTAALGRGLAGLANGTIVVNLPGSTGGVDDGLTVLADLLPHLRHQIRGEADHDHGAHQSAPHEVP